MSTVDSTLFKQVMARFPSGVTVITMKVDGSVHGMTASAFSSLSLEPPLVLVCVGKNQQSHKLLAQGKHYVVNFLQDGQEELSNHFSRPRPAGGEEFEGIPSRPGPNGAPLLEGCLAYASCDVKEVLPGGDHDIFVGHVKHLEIPSAQEHDNPLLYFKGRYRRLAE